MSPPISLVLTPVFTKSKIPDGVRNNAKWWAEDQISDSDFIYGMKFLIQNGIVRYDFNS